MSALLLPSEILSMTAQAARLLVDSGDGDGALLYLALLECGGDGDKAAVRLRWPADRLHAVWERLAALGLVQSTVPQAVQPPKTDDRPPDYSRGEVAGALEQEPAFYALHQEMENCLGRVLSDSDLKSLYILYDYLNLSPEVILTLTGWVIGKRSAGSTWELTPWNGPKSTCAASRPWIAANGQFCLRSASPNNAPQWKKSGSSSPNGWSRATATA